MLLTGQHRELVDELLPFFNIKPHIDLDVMRLGLPLERLAGHLANSISATLEAECPDMVLAQGDTTTVVATALACWQRGVPLGHVEAGLRTGQLFAPFPEEANRIVTSHLSTIHFAPTDSARDNLVHEGIEPRTIFVTGNTVIDSLYSTASREIPIGVELDPTRRLILVTAHRRDSFGNPSDRSADPSRSCTRDSTTSSFSGRFIPIRRCERSSKKCMTGLARVHLCRPLAYGPFVSAMQRAWIILTDSGGVQEEAPALGRPVLVMRNESERPEAIEAGVARLVGQDPATIVATASQLLADPLAYRSMARGPAPTAMAAPRQGSSRLLGDTSVLGDQRAR